MLLLQFLEHYSRRCLPAQLVLGDRLYEERAPAGFGVTLCEEPSNRKRVRRAARFAGFSVKDFVWRAPCGLRELLRGRYDTQPQNWSAHRE